MFLLDTAIYQRCVICDPSQSLLNLPVARVYKHRDLLYSHHNFDENNSTGIQQVQTDAQQYVLGTMYSTGYVHTYV